MVEIIGQILLGLGLMFTGVELLSSGLKRLSSRKFRKIATRFVSSRKRALLFGMGSGVIMQSILAVLMILASLITAGLLNVSQAIAILTGFSVGNTILLYFIALHIESAVTFIVGVCGIALYFSKSDHSRSPFLIGMGLGKVLERLSNSCMESIDLFINLALEAQKSNTAEGIAMFKKLSSGNSPSMERVRNEYINSDVLVMARDKGSMLDFTIVTEKII